MSDQQQISIKNRRASFEYAFLEKFIAGIQLRGSEIKALRLGKANISDAYCVIEKSELWVRNMQIEEYAQASYNNHKPKRDRKLLLNKSELKKIESKLSDKGIAVVPITLFINEKGLAKLEIALAKGKKVHDKREDIKKRDIQREIGRMIK
jgi:SsrA-binding protein